MTTNSEVSVDAIMICLNDAATIHRSVKTLLRNDIARLIVVDGGSRDETVAKVHLHGIGVIVSTPGIRLQVLEANKHVQSDFVFAAEADQEYHPDLVAGLLEELISQQLDGIQVTKSYSGKANWFEKSHGRFLEIHRQPPGPATFVSGPQLWKSTAWKELIRSTSVNEGFSFDTELSRIINIKGFRVGVSALESEEVGGIDFDRFLTRMKNYGSGDYWFYKSNYGMWSARRKAQSILHIARRYFVQYPLRALQRRQHVPSLVLYLWLMGVLRYTFWVIHFAKNSFRRYAKNEKHEAAEFRRA